MLPKIKQIVGVIGLSALLPLGCGIAETMEQMNQKMDQMNNNLVDVKGSTKNMEKGLHITNSNTGKMTKDLSTMNRMEDKMGEMLETMEDLKNEMVPEVQKMAETTGTLNGSIENMNNAMNLMLQHMETMSKSIGTVSDNMDAIGDLMGQFGVTPGADMNPDAVLERAYGNLKDSHAAQLIPMFIDFQKQQLANQGAMLYDSGSPQNRYVAIGNLIAYGNVSTLGAYTGIDGDIMISRPFDEENLVIDYKKNSFVLVNGPEPHKIAPIMEREFFLPVEWSLGTAGVIKTINERIGYTTKLPYFTAEALDHAGIVAIFTLNMLADRPDLYHEKTAEASWLGRLFSKWNPFNVSRVSGIEHQSFLMIEWYAHQMVCEFQNIVKRIEDENESAPTPLKTDEITLANLKVMATQYVPLSIKRYLTTRGYGPYATRNARANLIERDFRRVGQKKNSMQLVWDSNWERNISLCAYANAGEGETLDEFVDKTYSGEYPRETK